MPPQQRLGLGLGLRRHFLRCRWRDPKHQRYGVWVVWDRDGTGDAVKDYDVVGGRGYYAE